MKPKTAGRIGGRSHFADPIASASYAQSGVDVDAMTGIVMDAQIVTMSGMRAIQSLRVGEKIISRDSGAVRVERIEKLSIVAKAVYIFAGSLGHSRPDRDSLLPAGQPVLVRDWRAQALTQKNEAIMAASSLIDGEFIRNIGLQPMTVIRLFCSKPEIVYADGLELGTADAQTAMVTGRIDGNAVS